jgi:hypothetical protein
VKAVNGAGQTISYCAVNYHQNGIAEKKIRDLQDLTYTPCILVNRSNACFASIVSAAVLHSRLHVDLATPTLIEIELDDQGGNEADFRSRRT